MLRNQYIYPRCIHCFASILSLAKDPKLNFQTPKDDYLNEAKVIQSLRAPFLYSVTEKEYHGLQPPSAIMKGLPNTLVSVFCLLQDIWSRTLIFQWVSGGVCSVMRCRRVNWLVIWQRPNQTAWGQKKISCLNIFGVSLCALFVPVFSPSASLFVQCGLSFCLLCHSFLLVSVFPCLLSSSCHLLSWLGWSICLSPLCVINSLLLSPCTLQGIGSLDLFSFFWLDSSQCFSIVPKPSIQMYDFKNIRPLNLTELQSLRQFEALLRSSRSSERWLSSVCIDVVRQLNAATVKCQSERPQAINKKVPVN